MIFNGIKFHHVFTAGDYPQGSFTAEQVADIAYYYNPSFREAPVWIGHNKDKSQTLGVDEPRALAWVKVPVLAIDGKLYVSLGDITDELYYLVEQKYFKYVSVELYVYKLQDDTKIYYLAAIGLTNRPAVEGLEPLSFGEVSNSNNYVSAKFTQQSFEFTEKFDETRILEKINFTFQINSNNQNQIQMNLTENTKKILTSVGLDASKFVTEEVAQEAITKHFTDSKSEVATLKAKVTELENKSAGASSTDPKFTQLESEVNKLKEDRAESLVMNAIKDKKILPADKQVYVDLAKSDYDLAAKTLTAMTVNPALAGQQISTESSQVVDLTNPKFTKADGKQLTYDEITKKPSLVAQHGLTLQEVEALKKASGK